MRRPFALVGFASAGAGGRLFSGATLGSAYRRVCCYF